MWSCLDGTGMSAMMVLMSLFWLLTGVALVLGIAALLKYLARRPEQGRPPAAPSSLE